MHRQILPKLIYAYVILLTPTYLLKIATIIAVYANWGFARIQGIGWGWAGVIWLYSIVFYIPLDIFKFAIKYGLSGKAWDTMLEKRVEISISAITWKMHFLSPYFRLMSIT